MMLVMRIVMVTVMVMMIDRYGELVMSIKLTENKSDAHREKN